MSAQHESDPTQPGVAPESPDAVAAGDATAAEAPVLNPVEVLQAQLAEALAQLEAQKELVLRAHADAENVRRRSQDDVAKAHKFGTESFAESLVPVKDSLEAALALHDQSAEAWRDGVEATLKQLVSAFERNRLTEVAPVPGDKFDPHQHQSISRVPSELPANTVVQLLQKGYLISERVLRPALVTVSAGG